MKKNIKQFLLINLGLLVMAIGLHFFLIAADLAVGGITGLAMVINHYLPQIPIGVIMMGFNIMLFILALLILGKEFTGYTLYSSFALSGMIYLFDLLIPMNGPMVDDILLNLLFGIVIQGIGMGLIFYQNASTGGTDIIAKIINKFTHMDIGKALLLADFAVAIFAGLAFGFALGLWALVGIVMNGLVIDRVIAGFEMKLNVVVISNEYELINDFVLEVLDRSTTIYEAHGGYSGTKKQVVQTILNKKEYIRLKQYIKTIDPQAFLSVGFIHEVLGEGFNQYLNQ
ncbi:MULTISPECIES: YitT family protein [unclassified Fusibacter]|uniref:YitT family protein n=1 Tax=unclassified Fusibacter TaxID=2624464 RepID=UPI00101332D9|nr:MULTISPECIES: YitT family protein [unclassified Fusibacter]MCK8061285.1 YitT family protein [Fusibacter sp. A2]NPE23517.1 YitT family protein [Fusibacter sp. A1]RXV59121.1 YitT family protein [Fusibacter sp. A1]